MPYHPGRWHVALARQESSRGATRILSSSSSQQTPPTEGDPAPAAAAARVHALDATLFDHVLSQTSRGARRSLLAAQRAIASAYFPYVYLEIGSHLGGSIQPHLLDPRCEKIVSIDPRPTEQPDDRSPGYVAHYEDNSTERMLELLRQVSPEADEKIVCYTADASEVIEQLAEHRPQLAFIDGEHTNRAVRSDFDACRTALRDRGLVLFHDFGIVRRGIREICRQLKDQGVAFTRLKLESTLFAICFEPALVDSDPYLSRFVVRGEGFWLRYEMKWRAGRCLPRGLVRQWIAWRKRVHDRAFDKAGKR